MTSSTEVAGTKVLAGERTLSRRSLLRTVVSASASAIAWPALSAAGASQQPSSAADFINSVGVGLHLARLDTPYAKFDKVVELLQDVGIKQLRDLAIYQTSITRDHQYYQRVRKLVGLGYRFSLVCMDPTNPYIYCPPRLVPEIYNWCDSGVEIFEGGNEPDLAKRASANPAVSADHQRALYGIVKSTPSLRNVTVASPSYILRSLPLVENISDVVDWINLHPYPGMEHPETNGPGLLTGFIDSAQRFCGNKPVLITETGYHTAVQTTKPHLPVSEPIKVRYMPRLLLWGFKKGAQRSYIYELIDSFNNGPTDPESNFGLVSYDGTPKPSFFVVKRLLSLFDRPATGAKATAPFRFDVVGNTQDLQTAVFRRNDGSHLLFLWLGVSGWDRVARTTRPPVSREVQLALNPLPRNIRAHLFQDDAKVVNSQTNPTEGSFKVSVSDQLTAIEIEG